MSPTIQHDDAVRILRRIESGDDPLGMAPPDHDVLPMVEEEVRHHARRLLSGELEVPEDVPVTALDPITAHLLLHLGARPLAVAALCAAARGLGIVDDAGDNIATLMSTAPMTLVHADPLRWDSSSGHLRVPALPETVVASLAGRRLADVVSHAALDALDIEIVSATRDEGEAWMTLHVFARDPDVLLGRQRLEALRRVA